MVDDRQCPLHHFFRIFPDRQITWDDIGLATILDYSVPGVGVTDVSLSEDHSRTSLSEG